jgi:FtsH-binding integral membrane protein
MKRSDSEIRRERMFEQVDSTELISEELYNLVVGLTVCSGFLINFFVMRFFAEPLSEMSYGVSILMYFLFSFGGMFIAYRSNSAALSYAGFALLAVGFSVILNGVVYYYAPQTVVSAIYVTLGATVLMMVISTIVPKFFAGLGKILFISLLVVIVVEVVMMFAGIIEPTALDFLVSLLFCGYIGFDWSRAQSYPKTMNNAIDASVDIYVDIVNLFLRILSILGKRN